MGVPDSTCGTRQMPCRTQTRGQTMTDATQPEAPTETGSRSRRALMTGGAVLLGGAVLGSQGRAEAADGSSLLVGRSTNTAKSTTKLTTSGNNQSLNVTNTNTGTQAHGILSYTKNGYG